MYLPCFRATGIPYALLYKLMIVLFCACAISHAHEHAALSGLSGKRTECSNHDTACCVTPLPCDTCQHCSTHLAPALPSAAHRAQDPTGATARALPRPDGVQLYVRDLAVSAGTQQRGLVVMVHGWSWHSRYFMPLAHKLAEAGARACLLSRPPCRLVQALLRLAVSNSLASGMRCVQACCVWAVFRCCHALELSQRGVRHCAHYSMPHKAAAL